MYHLQHGLRLDIKYPHEDHCLLIWLKPKLNGPKAENAENACSSKDKDFWDLQFFHDIQ